LSNRRVVRRREAKEARDREQATRAARRQAAADRRWPPQAA
jgi:hypothetical protein